MSEPRHEVACFKSPPVIEMGVGVTFAALPKLLSIHFGLFWDKVRQEYPTIEVQPYAPPVLERFDTASSQISASVNIVVGPLGQEFARYWFVSADGTRVLQLQRDKFVFSWRRKTDTDVYPEFHKVIRPGFEKKWRELCSFFKENELGEPAVQQIELTYVNFIDKGNGWETFDDIPSIIDPWRGIAKDRGLPPLENVMIQTGFLVPESKGRVRIAVHPSPQQKALSVDGISLAIVARVQPVSTSPDAVMEPIDTAHFWAVKSFVAVLSSKIQELWGRTK